MEFIQSKDNKTIKHIISLGQRKNRQKSGEYIVEGIRSIRDIAAMGAVKTIFIRESKSQDKNVLDLLALDAVQSVPTYIVQDPVFDKVDNTVNGQGVVAIVAKPKHDIDSVSIEDGLYITLDGVQDPGNLGTIIRTAVAADVKGIFLMKGTVDPFNDQTVRSTVLGNEGNGVTPEVMNLCTNRIMIPMYGDMESLNVSVAAALCMYKVQEQLMS